MSINRILRTIWGIYGSLIFIILLVLLIPVYFIGFNFFGKSAEHFLLKLGYKYIAGLTLFLMGIRLKIYGQEQIASNKHYVLVSNHQSALDILVNAYASPVIYKFLSKAEVRDIPIIGYIASKLCILTDRKSKASRTKSYKNLKENAEAGTSILLYPEGTRNRTKKLLRPFYDGAFRLAIETKTPIIVQTLVNTGGLSSPFHVLDLSPGIVEYYIEAPIETKEMTLDDMSALKLQVQEIMEKHLTQHSPSISIPY